MTQPPFISLDGLDGAGKSTQCRLLAEWLRALGWQVTECADPGGTAVGKVVRDLLLHQRGDMTLICEALLFMASRAQLIEEVIRPALAAGRAVVSDRYLLANIVYQGHAGGLDPNQLRNLGLIAASNLEPALTFVLDLPIEAAHARRKKMADRMESREVAYHAKVREGFLKEAAQRPDKIAVIDATQSPEMMQSAIRSEVEFRFPDLRSR